MMKWFFVFVLCVQASGARSQEIRVSTFKVVLQDSAYRQFFDADAGIKWMAFDFEEDRPVSWAFYRDPNAPYYSFYGFHNPYELYDLEFDGDLYWISKKYPTFTLPELPKAAIVYNAYMPDTTVYANTGQKAKMVAYRDSIVCYFSQSHYPNEDEEPAQNRNVLKAAVSPFLKGGSDVFAKRCEEHYSASGNIEPATMETITIFSALVERDGSLHNIKQVAGSNTYFSEAVRKTIGETRQSWNPAIQGGRPVKSIVLIYARLNSDRSVTASMGLDRGHYQVK